MSKENENGNFVKGFALTGAEVKNSEKKTFTFVEEPTYKEFEDQTTKEVKETLKCRIDFNGAVVDYYPNKTSMGVIIACKGRNMADWVGFSGEFETVQQKVGKEMKDVIYIKVPESGESK